MPGSVVTCLSPARDGREEQLHMIVRRQAGKVGEIVAAENNTMHMRTQRDHSQHRQAALPKLVANPFDFILHMGLHEGLPSRTVWNKLRLKGHLVFGY